jgi:hypothetical protein
MNRVSLCIGFNILCCTTCPVLMGFYSHVILEVQHITRASMLFFFRMSHSTNVDIHIYMNTHSYEYMYTHPTSIEHLQKTELT